MAGGKDEVKLLGVWANPFVLRVKLVLILKGIGYEYVEQDLKSKRELLLKSTPVNQDVRLLMHDDKPVCESLIILQYVDEAFIGVGPSLLPEEPHDHAVSRFWAAYINGTLVQASSHASTSKTKEEKAEGKKQTAATVETLEGALRDYSNGKPFFDSEIVGYVDVMLGGLLPLVQAADKMKGAMTFDPATTPLLAVWVDQFGSLDTVEAVMPDVTKLVEFAMSMHAPARAVAAAVGM